MSRARISSGGRLLAHTLRDRTPRRPCWCRHAASAGARFARTSRWAARPGTARPCHDLAARACAEPEESGEPSSGSRSAAAPRAPARPVCRRARLAVFRRRCPRRRCVGARKGGTGSTQASTAHTSTGQRPRAGFQEALAFPELRVRGSLLAHATLTALSHRAKYVYVKSGRPTSEDTRKFEYQTSLNFDWL